MHESTVCICLLYCQELPRLLADWAICKFGEVGTHQQPPFLFVALRRFSSSGASELVSTVDFWGRPVEHVLVTVNLPQTSASESLADATAEVAGDHVHVTMPEYKPLEVQLPFAVTAEGATATLSKDNNQLCLKLPYLPCKDFLQQVQFNHKLCLACAHNLTVLFVCVSSAYVTLH